MYYVSESDMKSCHIVTRSSKQDFNIHALLRAVCLPENNKQVSGGGPESAFKLAGRVPPLIQYPLLSPSFFVENLGIGASQEARKFLRLAVLARKTLIGGA
jgi:hypothetical protein